MKMCRKLGHSERETDECYKLGYCRRSFASIENRRMKGEQKKSVLSCKSVGRREARSCVNDLKELRIKNAVQEIFKNEKFQ